MNFWLSTKGSNMLEGLYTLIGLIIVAATIGQSIDAAAKQICIAIRGKTEESNKVGDSTDEVDTGVSIGGTTKY